MHLAGLIFCWTVTATPISVHDGDTFKANVYIWPRLTAQESIRVQGVDTPELKGETKTAALEAKKFTEAWLQDTDVILYTCGDRSFERLVAKVTRSRDNAVLADDLVKAGHGKVRLK